jgi:ribose 5-phosphate isomerase A
MLHTAKAIRPATRLYSTAAGIEQGKRAAAYRAVNDYIDKSKKVVGIGSGSTIRYAVDCLREKQDLRHIVYIPTSFQSRQLIQQAKLTLSTLEQ